MTLRVGDLQSDSDLDKIRNSCDVFNEGNGFCICREASLVLLVFPMLECKGKLFCILKFGKRHPLTMIEHCVMKNHTLTTLIIYLEDEDEPELDDSWPFVKHVPYFWPGGKG